MTALEIKTKSALSDEIKEFLKQHKDKHDSFKYVEQIDQMMPKNARFIVIDYNDLVSHPQIESKFNESPDEILTAFSRAIKEILQERFTQYAAKIKDDIRARIVNYPVQRSLRQINAEIINKMTSVSGMVVRSSEIKPLAKEIAYKCSNNHEFHITLEKGMAVPPLYRCGSDPKCTSKEFTIQPEKSRFIDFQIARLQELPEDLPPGQLPHYVDVTIKQDLVDNARPGDRIILSGIVRIEQESLIGSRTTSGLYRLRIEGNNVEFLGGRGKKTSRKIQREEISPEEEKQIKSLAELPDIYQRLIDSFAPHIQGHALIKEAILLLVVGSTQRSLQDGTKIRGDINIFLVGDPGTAKSEMLKFCARIAPRGLYTSGRGSTAAGLTAAVVKDIVATLNARTSILAAANPMYGKYDPFKNITENVNLPIPLLTRFDLIFVVRDIPSKEKDAIIAKHIINLHTPTGNDTRSLIDSDILTKYLGYAKRNNPILTKEAEEKILEYYMKMRNVDSEDMITVTPRQLEGLIRLATARARILLKDQVEAEDAERAIFLIESMLQDAGVDVNTGKVDLGVLQGRAHSEVSKMQLFMDVLKSLEGENKAPVEEKLFITELVKSGKFTEEEARNYVRRMLREASIYESRPGHYNRV
jgi:replicative DNA helicase Mcm